MFSVGPLHILYPDTTVGYMTHHLVASGTTIFCTEFFNAPTYIVPRLLDASAYANAMLASIAGYTHCVKESCGGLSGCLLYLYHTWWCTRMNNIHLHGFHNDLRSILPCWNSKRLPKMLFEYNQHVPTPGPVFKVVPRSQ